MLVDFFEIGYNGRFCVFVVQRLWRPFLFYLFIISRFFVMSGIDFTIEIFAVYSSVGWLVVVLYSTTRISCADLRYSRSFSG